MEFTLLGAAAVALGAAWLGLSRAGAPERADLRNAVVGAVIAGLATGRIWAMLATGVNPLTHPTDILIVRGGVATGAATLGALAFLAVSRRADLWRQLDLIAPAALLGLAGWHAGCVVRGTCLGTPTGLPWGMTAPGSTIARHPVEIYAALLFLAAAVALHLLRSRRSGLWTGGALLAAAAIRLATEPMRPALGDDVRLLYAGGVLAALVLLGWRLRAAHPPPD